MSENEKLKKAMEAKGLTNPRLAKIVGCAPVEIWRLVKGPDHGGRKMSPEWAARIAPALGISPADLLFDDGYEPAEIHGLPVISVAVAGDVAAGMWFEEDDFCDDPPAPIPAVPGPFSVGDQRAFKVVGDSMNALRIFPGDYLIAAPYFLARSNFTNGDIVIVERRNGALTERTVKELKLSNGGYELWPRSTNPRWSAPIIVPDKRSPDAQDGTTVEVSYLVIGRYSPMSVI